MSRHLWFVRSSLAAVILQFAFCNLQFAIADDWPQFRGPNRDDVSKETGLLKQWLKNEPKLLWTYNNAGAGYSGPAIVGDRLYTMGARGDSEYVFALDLKSAKGNNVTELWAAKIGPIFRWKGNPFNEGPSATPTVDSGLIYALGGQGELVCVEAATGQAKWRKNLPKDLKAEVDPVGGGLGTEEGDPKLGWGFTWSPLVDGEQLVLVPGGPEGAMAALDKKTGELLWRSKELTDRATYSSPVVAEIDGQRQYLIMTGKGVAGVSAKDGSLLWYYKRKPAYFKLLIPTPLLNRGYIYTTAYEGCDLVRLAASDGKIKATSAYKRDVRSNMKASPGSAVLVGEHVYGYSEGLGWVCQEFNTGQIVELGKNDEGEPRLWSERQKLGKGSLTYADGNLYCFNEDEGTIALVEATPKKKWNEKGRFTIPQQTKQRLPEGRIWTYPVVANGRLYLRDQELLFCYDVKGN